MFEVERPEVLEYKEAILKSLGAEAKIPRRVVAVDLRDDFGGPLRAAGFMESQPTLFLMEGLLPYLDSENTVLSLLSKIAAMAAPGSVLAFDTIGESFLKSAWTRPFLNLMTAAGAPWQFGTDDPEGLLSTMGALATTLFGVLTGYCLRSQTRTPIEKVTGMFIAGNMSTGMRTSPLTWTTTATSTTRPPTSVAVSGVSEKAIHTQSGDFSHGCA
jgi:O-methyltransferase involved in polyketide biosynthesis